ncbi:MAG: hypothetical protein QHH07_05890 [Sedimentisphaerales bacterium]|jgi:anti-sigma factor RsiW|nr:hypothetical protein [Sedimentisphaerales bacterium]
MDRCQSNIEGLINKYLDGEITAREMEDLRASLQTDPAAKGLFEKLQQVDRYCQEAIQRYVVQVGRPVEDLVGALGSARTTHIGWARWVRQGAWLRFAAGVAAGLILGAVLSVAVLFWRGESHQARENLAGDKGLPVQEQPLPRVDIYYYRDSQGNLWAIEGLSEQRIKNVAYQVEF